MIKSEKLKDAIAEAHRSVPLMEIQDEADAVVSFDEESLDAVKAGLRLGEAVAKRSGRHGGTVRKAEVFHASYDGVHYLVVAETEEEACERFPGVVET